MDGFLMAVLSLVAACVGLVIVLLDGEVRLLREINGRLEERAGLRNREER